MRLRGMADRQGLRLTKSHRRDPRASDYGRWYLADARSGTLIDDAGLPDLDAVETFLSRPPVGEKS